MKGYVYLIRNKDLYKIGITQNIDNRMKALRPDEILRVFKTNRFKQLEKRLHAKYRNVRIPQTEYFRLSQSMVKNCKTKLTYFSHHRSESKPWLIAASTMVTPFICIFWGSKQRSWSLALIPFASIFVEDFINSSYELNPKINFLFKVSAGIFAYIISTKNKVHALK